MGLIFNDFCKMPHNADAGQAPCTFVFGCDRKQQKQGVVQNLNCKGRQAHAHQEKPSDIFKGQNLVWVLI